MDPLLFQQRFNAASAFARRFHQEGFDRPLPEQLLFRFNPIGISGPAVPPDLDPPPGYPTIDRRSCEELLTSREAIAQLWRGGLVPEWIDFRVTGHTSVATIIELDACALFLGDETRLMHQKEGWAPFHVVGFYPQHPGVQELPPRPAPTAGYGRDHPAILYLTGAEIPADQAVSVEIRHAIILCSDATTDQVVSLLRPARGTLRTLNLHGTSVDDSIFSSLPDFSRLYNVSLDETGVTQAAIDRFAAEHPSIALSPRPTGWHLSRDQGLPGPGGSLT